MFKVKYGHILSRFETCLDSQIWVVQPKPEHLATLFYVHFRLLQRFPIILVQRTFLKSGIQVTLNYIITLYSPLQTILSLHLRPFCVHASDKHTNVWELLLYTLMKNLKKNRCHGPGTHRHACSLFYYSEIY
jgi:hypothetical protein